MDKTLVITRENIESNPFGSFVTIHSVMLYPEDETARESYIDSYILTALEESPESSRAKYIREESEFLASVFGKYPYPEKHLSRSHHSRQAGRTGSKLLRGLWSGMTLMHLLKPSIGSLEKAYGQIRKRYELHPNIIEQYLEKLGVPAKDQPKKPSKALLRVVWSELKNASHFWGAASVLFFTKGVDLFHPNWIFENPTNLSPHLSLFLGVASFHRKRLIESNILTTSGPHIKDPLQVWNIVDEHLRSYQPIEVFYEKY